MTELEPLGVIDIGSNSVRLVVYEGAVRAATPLFNEKVLCGLGRSVATTGQLGEEPIAKALEALDPLPAIARILKVKNLRAIATAAVREAEDGASSSRVARRPAARRSKSCPARRKPSSPPRHPMGFVAPTASPATSAAAAWS